MSSRCFPLILVMLISLTTFLFVPLARAQHRPHDPPASEASQDDGEYFFQFVTRPDIGAPRWDIEVHDSDALAPGYWFIAPYANLQQFTYPLWNGPHIYDQNGDLIWSGAPQFEHKNIYDFRVSTVNDKDMITFNFPYDHTHGEAFILDHTYNIHKLVDMVGNNTGPNMHDFNLIDNGRRALFLTAQDNEETRVSLPWFNGTCQVGWQGFKEVDVATGEVIFEWNDRGHVHPNESTYTPRTSKTFAEECAQQWGQFGRD